MTHAQLVRRLTNVVSTLKQLRDRIDAITVEVQPPTAKQAKKARKSQPGRYSSSSAMGRAIVYGGLKGKIVDSTGKKFIAKMENGKRQEISAVYVYRQLSRKAKTAKPTKGKGGLKLPKTEKLPAPTDQPGLVAEAEALVHDQQQTA